MTQNTIYAQLRRLARLAETRNLDSVSAKLAAAMREVTAASSKDSQIEIESWPDFLNWWNNNRGQNLIYIFQDTYGNDAEQVTMVRKLVRDSEKHEKDLHDFYMRLRDMATNNQQGEAEETNAAPAVPAEPAEPAADDLDIDEPSEI